MLNGIWYDETTPLIHPIVFISLYEHINLFSYINMTRYFIPLGFHCNITFLSQDIRMKHETSLFEWIQSEKLQYITDIINNIKDTININIIKGSDKNIHILHEKVFTYHYELEEYKSMFMRRAIRFLDIIKTSKELLFIRINPIYYSTTTDEINNFCEAIHSIQPALDIKFLMIHKIHDYSNYTPLDVSKISSATLIQKEFLLNDCPDEYLRNNTTIQQQFLQYLQECGIDINTSVHVQFNDKS